MKAKKAEKYKELKQSGNKKLFEEWFLNYKPDNEEKKSVNKKTKTTRKKTKTNSFLNAFKNGSKTRKNKKNNY
jgi:hypothetical protein